MADTLALYRALVARGTQPALTWYGAQGRMELSGKVSANHLAKIAGYLADELWLEPGSEVELDLPAHWKQVLWGLGAMLAGLHVRVAGADSMSPPNALITAHPEAHDPSDGGTDAVAALDLGPLALRWTGAPLPPGTYDASAEVLGSPDQLMDTSRHTSSNFAAWQARGKLTEESDRLLLALEDSPHDAEVALACATGQLCRGGLVVVETGLVQDVARIEGATITKFNLI